MLINEYRLSLAERGAEVAGRGDGKIFLWRRRRNAFRIRSAEDLTPIRGSRAEGTTGLPPVANTDRKPLLSELLISADSHVLEPSDLWTKGLPAGMRARAPRVYFSEERGAWLFGCDEVAPQPITFSFIAGVDLDDLPEMHKAGYAAARAGGWDPIARMADMEADGVSAEVLYPSLGLGLFWITDAAFQEACFRAYNDWLIAYCGAMPDRLVGIGMISLYAPGRARGRASSLQGRGMRGAMIWQRPPASHAFTVLSSTRSGRPPRNWICRFRCTSSRTMASPGAVSSQGRWASISYRTTVMMQYEIEQSLDLIFSGVLERFPRLKIVSVETEYNWLASLMVRMDASFERHRRDFPLGLTMKPSEYVRRQVRVTFFNDALGPLTLPFLGCDMLLWSNDYPHQNSTWPHSREVIARDFAGLEPIAREKPVSGNVALLHRIAIRR